MESKSPFLHERLDAYALSLEFYKVASAIRARLPRGLGQVGDQLSRASQSVCLNIAEGAASRSREVKRRHWDIALGSAAECAAALDLIEIDRAAMTEQLESARSKLKGATVRVLGLMR